LLLRDQVSESRSVRSIITALLDMRQAEITFACLKTRILIFVTAATALFEKIGFAAPDASADNTGDFGFQAVGAAWRFRTAVDASRWTRLHKKH